ncbi:MAG: ABC transporter permease [Bacteroidales bacterium]|nr:ABC transporter permease [Bacteroidales bacterium]
MSYVSDIGEFTLLMKSVFSKPEQGKMFRKQIILEIDKIGINSIGIVLIVSSFIGAVVTMQTAYNMSDPLFPDYLVGLSTRDISLLEFSSTVMCLILAGKIGSNIASEIGTMKVTQQVDALEIMGVNSSNYLILPKIIAAVFSFPILSLISMIVSMMGGWIAGMLSGSVSSSQFLYGLRYGFIPYYLYYSLIKVVTYSLIITAISSYYGYRTEGGALEVGKSSTKAVVSSSLFILVFDLLLTSLLL